MVSSSTSFKPLHYIIPFVEIMIQINLSSPIFFLGLVEDLMYSDILSPELI